MSVTKNSIFSGNETSGKVLLDQLTTIDHEVITVFQKV